MSSSFDAIQELLDSRSISLDGLPVSFRNDARAKGSANHVGVSEVDADQLVVAVNTYEKKLRSARFIMIMIMKPAITARASAGRPNGHQSMFDSDEVAGRTASDMGSVTSPTPDGLGPGTCRTCWPRPTAVAVYRTTMAPPRFMGAIPTCMESKSFFFTQSLSPSPSRAREGYSGSPTGPSASSKAWYCH